MEQNKKKENLRQCAAIAVSEKTGNGGLVIRTSFKPREMVWIIYDFHLLHLPIHEIRTNTQSETSSTEWCLFLVKKNEGKKKEESIKVSSDWVFRDIDEIVAKIREEMAEVERQERENE